MWCVLSYLSAHVLVRPQASRLDHRSSELCQPLSQQLHGPASACSISHPTTNSTTVTMNEKHSFMPEQGKGGVCVCVCGHPNWEDEMAAVLFSALVKSTSNVKFCIAMFQMQSAIRFRFRKRLLIFVFSSQITSLLGLFMTQSEPLCLFPIYRARTVRTLEFFFVHKH